MNALLTKLPRLAPQSLRANVVWTLGGQLTYLTTQFLLLATLARVGGPKTLGRYALAVSIATPVFALANLHLRVVQSTDVGGRFSFATCRRLRLATTSTAIALIAVWSMLLDDPVASLAVMLLGLARAADSFSEAYYGEFQKRERLDFVSQSMIARGLLSAASFIAVYLLTASLPWAVSMLTLASIGTLLGIDHRRYRRETPAAERETSTAGLMALLPLLLFALPAGFVNSANAWMTNLPRLVLERFHGTESLGLFAVVTYLMVAAGTFILAINQSALTRLAKYARSDAAAFTRLFHKLIAIHTAAAVVCITLAVVVGRYALAVLFDYRDPALVMPFRLAMLAASVRFLTRPLLIAVRAQQQHRTLAISFASILAIVAAASWWLIPSGGLVGASLTLLAGALAELGVLSVAYRRVVVPRLRSLAEGRPEPTSQTPTALPVLQPRSGRPLDFCIVGMPKCGTTALYRYLQAHPGTHLPHIKEPHYFCDDFPAYRRIRTADDYTALFATADRDQAIGEASVFYLYSQTAVANLLADSPDCRLVVMLRRPPEMLASYHNQLVVSQRETETSFAAAWAKQSDRAAGRGLPPHCLAPSHLQYGEIARFGSHLRRLYEVADREQVLVLFQDEMEANPGLTYRRTLSFLGLPDDGRSAFPREYASHAHRWPRLSGFLMHPPGALGVAKTHLKRMLNVRGSVLRPLYHRVLFRPHRREPIPPALDREIIQTLRDDIALLAELTGRNLSHWHQPADDPRAAEPRRRVA